MQEGVKHIKEKLSAHYPENEISGFVRIIIEHITSSPYPIALINNTAFTSEQEQRIEDIINRLLIHEPIQYILGQAEFFGLPFKVNKNVLIPRPETEELVELIINENQGNHLSILDIGTGSGCIAIALSKYLPNANITAWDISSGALEVATENALNNQVQVVFRQVDVLSDYPMDKMFDIIVSNPPYILDSEKVTMEENVLQYEPHSALFVPDNNGLLFYKRIADIALKLLKPSGKLYFEINQTKGKDTMETLIEKGFHNTELFRDMNGNDRIVRCIMNE